MLFMTTCVCVCLSKNECLLVLSEPRRDGGSDVMALALPLPKPSYYYSYFILLEETESVSSPSRG